MQIRPSRAVRNIGIVAPARKADELLLREGGRMIEAWGVNVQYGQFCFDKDNNYLASSDINRLSDFQNMLDDHSLDAIFCARGGYGTTRIIDDLDFRKFKENPKWIIGFSDITALHLKLYQLGVQSIHGCMPIQFHKHDYESSIESIKYMLLQNKPTPITTHGSAFNRSGQASGIIIGGNLSLVVDSLGTITEPDTKQKILVVEEIDERLYKVDRMFVQLQRANKLTHLSGLVIGHMTGLSDTDLPFNQKLEEIVMSKVANYNYPVGFNFPIGHESPNFAWPHGANATLQVSATGSALTFT